jgi:putative transcriptional regulator
MASKHKSRIARVVHEAAADAHKAGVMDKTTMRKFDSLCLAEVPELSPKEIQALRERENVSQAVLARHLNVTTGLISQWERGERRPR